MSLQAQRVGLFLAVAAFVVAGASCRSSSAKSSGSTISSAGAAASTPTEAGLRAAATAYASAFLTGSYKDVSNALDPSCAESGPSSSGLASGDAWLRRFRLALKREVGIDAATVKIRGVAVRNYTGRAGDAEAQYALAQSAVGNDNWNSYAFSDGRWHIAGCDLKAPIGGQDTPAKPKASTP